ncbi:MAG TPA: hypothetical protein PK307_13555 [Spirochaetota bacterium]|nr:hypothetical protein [Spirochaetota bacterium]HOD13575.1 hypothetical protein [Spirochaetota bacterium]HPG49719.1 hypothetical protein [Spirochaetota bacterium]HPN10437.1 hypothetical protein [Spirochaetota bacterium]HQL83226.1 hypothetical protein [Spirochaetota bacterium]
MAEIRNRRRGPDTMVRMITLFSIGSWLLIFIALLVYQLVHPLTGSYSSVRMNLTGFSAGIILARVLLAANVLLCVWGMVMNIMRNKRKSDRFRVSLLISAVISLAGLILMIVLL